MENTDVSTLSLIELQSNLKNILNNAEGNFQPQQLGFSAVADSNAPGEYSVMGQFQLFPAEVPLNIKTNLHGIIKKDDFMLQGNLEATNLLPGLAMTNESSQIQLDINSILLLLKLLGSETKAQIVQNEQNILVDFNSSFGAMQNVLNGSIAIAADYSHLTGNLNLELADLISYKANFAGELNDQGFILSGNSTLKVGLQTGLIWIGLEGSGDVSVRNIDLISNLHVQGKVGPVNMPPVNAAVSLRSWQGRPCFMAAWRLAPLIWLPNVGDIHTLVIYLDNGTPNTNLFWRTWDGNWPMDLRPGG